MIFARFRRNEQGSATIEAVLWLPLFILFFSLLTDVAMVFHGQAQALRIVQDGNRNLSIGRLASADATASFIYQNMSFLAPNASVSTTVTDGLITSTVSVPVSDLDILGMFSALSNSTVTVRAQHLIEY